MVIVAGKPHITKAMVNEPMNRSTAVWRLALVGLLLSRSRRSVRVVFGYMLLGVALAVVVSRSRWQRAAIRCANSTHSARVPVARHTGRGSPIGSAALAIALAPTPTARPRRPPLGSAAGAMQSGVSPSPLSGTTWSAPGGADFPPQAKAAYTPAPNNA
jgi:hypothetical protein